MVKTVMPDAQLGRELLGLKGKLSDRAVLDQMYSAQDPECKPGLPKPMLKTLMYRGWK